MLYIYSMFPLAIILKCYLSTCSHEGHHQGTFPPPHPYPHPQKTGYSSSQSFSEAPTPIQAAKIQKIHRNPSHPSTKNQDSSRILPRISTSFCLQITFLFPDITVILAMNQDINLSSHL